MKFTTVLIMLAFVLTPASGLVLDQHTQVDAPLAVELQELPGLHVPDPHPVLGQVTEALECELGVPVRVTGYGGTIEAEQNSSRAFVADKHWVHEVTDRIPIYRTVTKAVGHDLLGLNPVTRTVSELVGYEEKISRLEGHVDIRFDVAWHAEFVHVTVIAREAYVKPVLAESYFVGTTPVLVCDEPVEDELPVLDGSGYDYWHTHLEGALLGVWMHQRSDEHEEHRGHWHGGKWHHGHHLFHASGWHAHHVQVDSRLASSDDADLPRGHCGYHGGHNHHGSHHGHHAHGSHGHCHRFLQEAIEDVYEEFNETSAFDEEHEERGEKPQFQAQSSPPSSGSLQVKPALPATLVATGLLLFFTRRFW